MKEEMYLNFMKYILILIVFFSVLLVLQEIFRNYRIKKKFDLITVKSIKEKDTSFKATLSKIFSYQEHFIINLFSKSKTILEYSKKYEKYNCLSNYSNILIFLRKIEVGFLISLLYVLLSIIEFSTFNFGLYLLIFVFSSYLMELSLEIRLKNRNKEIEDNLYDAINLLNKCFKAGKSINGSIDYLVKETNGAISDEFNLLLNDLNHGLSLNESFGRMNDRVNIENLNMITSSLTLLNTTGGNIVDLFDILCEDLLSKKKKKDEYSSLISSTKLLYKILLVIPFIVFFVLSITYDNYISYFMDNYIGVACLILIISLYILYILLIEKIMKEVK